MWTTVTSKRDLHVGDTILNQFNERMIVTELHPPTLWRVVRAKPHSVLGAVPGGIEESWYEPEILGIWKVLRKTVPTISAPPEQHSFKAVILQGQHAWECQKCGYQELVNYFGKTPPCKGSK